MANNNALGQFTEEVEQATQEVAEDVKDSMGEMIEQGVQTTFGPQLTPQQIQQKQEENQNAIAETRRKLNFYQETEARLDKAYQQTAQKEQQRKQKEEEEKQQKKMAEEENQKRIFSPAKKTPPVPGQPEPETEELARTRQETGKGHGVGG